MISGLQSAMARLRQDDFPISVTRKVAERAGYICSNPGCHRITIGPVTSDSAKSTKTGVAAHICAASPLGPRYDMSQSKSQRSSIDNAIWLCATCSVLIDKNGGLDYPVPDLKKWKRDHESLMKECLEGNKRVVFSFLSLSHATNTSEAGVAREVMHALEDKGALYMPYHREDPGFVMESMKQLRGDMRNFRDRVDDISPVGIIVESIARACRHYMNTTSDQASLRELEYSLGAVRKVIGINIGDLVKFYGLPMSTQLSSIVPQ